MRKHLHTLTTLMAAAAVLPVYTTAQAQGNPAVVAGCASCKTCKGCASCKAGCASCKSGQSCKAGCKSCKSAK